MRSMSDNIPDVGQAQAPHLLLHVLLLEGWVRRDRGRLGHSFRGAILIHLPVSLDSRSISSRLGPIHALLRHGFKGR